MNTNIAISLSPMSLSMVVVLIAVLGWAMMELARAAMTGVAKRLSERSAEKQRKKALYRTIALEKGKEASEDIYEQLKSLKLCDRSGWPVPRSAEELQAIEGIFKKHGLDVETTLIKTTVELSRKNTMISLPASAAGQLSRILRKMGGCATAEDILKEAKKVHEDSKKKEEVH